MTGDQVVSLHRGQPRGVKREFLTWLVRDHATGAHGDGTAISAMPGCATCNRLGWDTRTEPEGGPEDWLRWMAADHPAPTRLQQLFDRTDTHPTRTPPTGEPGAFDLHWAAETDPHTRKVLLVGRNADGALEVVFSPRLASRHASAGDVARVLAQLANDLPAGAAALMAASLDREGRNDESH